jgi:hypothetical protein
VSSPIVIDQTGPAAERLAPTPGAGLRLATRVYETFVAPRRLFARVDDATPFIGVLLISTLVAVIAAPVKSPEYFLHQMDDPVNRLGKPVVVTSGPEEIVRYGRMLAMLSALASHPLILLAIAGLLTLFFSVTGTARGSFRRHVVVAAHLLLIPALGALVGVGIALATGDLDAQPSLARLLSFAGPRFASDPFLDNIDLFSVWMLLTLGVAVATLQGRRSWVRPAAVLVAVYLLLASASAVLLR